MARWDNKTRELWVHCYAKDQCDTIYRADCHIPRVDFKVDFEQELGGDQVTHPFSFDCLPDFCFSDGDNNLYEWFFYTDDEVPVDSDADECSRADDGGFAVTPGGSGNNFATDDEVKDVFS